MYISMYIARCLIIVPFICLVFSIACCCNEKVERIAKKKAKIFVHLLAVGGKACLYLTKFVFSSPVRYRFPVIAGLPLVHHEHHEIHPARLRCKSFF